MHALKKMNLRKNAYESHNIVFIKYTNAIGSVLS